MATTEAVSTKIPADSICYIAQISTNVEWQSAAEKPPTQWFAIVREHKDWFWAWKFCNSLEGVLFYTENWPPAELDFFYNVIQDDEFWVGLFFNVYEQLKTAWGEEVNQSKVLIHGNVDNWSIATCVNPVTRILVALPRSWKNMETHGRLTKTHGKT